MKGSIGSIILRKPKILAISFVMFSLLIFETSCHFNSDPPMTQKLSSTEKSEISSVATSSQEAQTNRISPLQVLRSKNERSQPLCWISSPHPNYGKDSSLFIPPFIYRFDLKRSGRTEYRGPKKPDDRIEIKADGKIRASPALLPDGGVVFGTLGGSLYILNQDATIRNIVKMDSWIYSTPVVASDGTIYVGCDNGDVVAVSPFGDKKWTCRLRAETSSSPALYGGKMFIGAEDNALHAISTSGEKIWKFPTKQRILFSSPAIDDWGNIYIGAEDGILYQIKPDGTRGWEFKTKGEISLCSPTISPKGLIYIFSSDCNLYAVRSDGKLEWKFRPHEEISSNIALAKDGTIYAATLDGVFMAINDKGKLKWKKKITDKILSSPTIDCDDNIYIAEERGFISLDHAGKIRWRLDKIGGPFTGDSVISRTGCILVGGEDGVLYIIKDK